MDQVNRKIRKLYERCRDRWVSVQEMGMCVGFDASGREAILKFVSRPDVVVKEQGGLKVYRTPMTQEDE